MTLHENVIRALEHPEYDWRTLEGLAKDTALSAEQLAHVLEQLRDVIVTSTDRDGRRLVTTRKHYAEREPFANKALSAFAHRIR